MKLCSFFLAVFILCCLTENGVVCSPTSKTRQRVGFNITSAETYSHLVHVPRNGSFTLELTVSTGSIQTETFQGYRIDIGSHCPYTGINMDGSLSNSGTCPPTLDTCDVQGFSITFRNSLASANASTVTIEFERSHSSFELTLNPILSNSTSAHVGTCDQRQQCDFSNLSFPCSLKSTGMLGGKYGSNPVSDYLNILKTLHLVVPIVAGSLIFIAAIVVKIQLIVLDMRYKKKKQDYKKLSES